MGIRQRFPTLKNGREMQWDGVALDSHRVVLLRSIIRRKENQPLFQLIKQIINKRHRAYRDEVSRMKANRMGLLDIEFKLYQFIEGCKTMSNHSPLGL